MPDLPLTVRTSQPGRSIRFDVGDGTRLSVTFGAAGEKTSVAVEQERLPAAAAVETARAARRDRLNALKGLVEDGS